MEKCEKGGKTPENWHKAEKEGRKPENKRHNTAAQSRNRVQG